MKHFLLAVLVPFLMLAGCSSPAKGWTQQLADGKTGMHVQFDPKSDAFLAHTAPDASGRHDHIEGTYKFDEATKIMTVNAKLMGADKPGVWTGKMDGDAMTLTAGGDSLAFRRGGAAHGH